MAKVWQTIDTCSISLKHKGCTLNEVANVARSVLLTARISPSTAEYWYQHVVNELMVTAESYQTFLVCVYVCPNEVSRFVFISLQRFKISGGFIEAAGMNSACTQLWRYLSPPCAHDGPAHLHRCYCDVLQRLFAVVLRPPRIH